jgi:hypothetical protein
MCRQGVFNVFEEPVIIVTCILAFNAFWLIA